MIIILCESDSKDIAQAISDDLALAYNDKLEISILKASDAIAWPYDPAWDDLLIVLFKDNNFPEAGKKFIQEYCLRDNSFILPISVNSEHQKPPDPIGGIKAICFENENRGNDGHIIKRIGAMMGLRLRHRDHKIFISYRAIDGNLIADQLYAFLKQNGFNPWLDVAKDEYDAEPSIQGGEDVQLIIEKNLAEANLLLLIDTPKAIESRWINLEVDSAISQLIPILPICCKEATNPTKGPRFRPLRELQRWVEAKPCQGDILEEIKLSEILDEIENYLCEIYQRKLRVPFLVSREFNSRGFSWKIISQQKYLYGSEKQYSARVKHLVLSHCSIFNQISSPILRVILDNISGLTANYFLFVYDGELLPDNEIIGICSDTEVEAINLIILHHQEIPLLLDSDFKLISS
jgi:hypothetical protein